MSFHSVCKHCIHLFTFLNRYTGNSEAEILAEVSVEVEGVVVRCLEIKSLFHSLGVCAVIGISELHCNFSMSARINEDVVSLVLSKSSSF